MKHKDKILKEFDKLPLCYDDGIIENEDDGEFIRGQSHFKNHYKHFLSQALAQTREETIREEIKYWEGIFDNRPKDRDLESDNIAQNFARIEIERLENKLKK